MRRWVCILGFLAAFSRADYTWHAHVPDPIPIERLIDPDGPDPTVPWGASWGAT